MKPNILDDSMYITTSEGPNYRDREQVGGCQGIEARWGGDVIIKQ